MVYAKFPLSLRNVEDLLHERGTEISHETVRYWWNRFGPMFACEIRKRRAQQLRHITRWRWHLDEVYVNTSGVPHYLWRAVEDEGEGLKIYVTKTRDKSAALNFLRKAMERHGVPEIVVTDRLRSYRAAMKVNGNINRQEVGRRLTNHAQNSHLPFRRRARAVLRLRRTNNLPKFVSTRAPFHNRFDLNHHIGYRQTFKAQRDIALAEWLSF